MKNYKEFQNLFKLKIHKIKIKNQININLIMEF